MKTANFLSLSLFVSLAGLTFSIGCSSPAVGDLGDDSSADTAGDDDDDDDDTTTPVKKSTTSNTTTTTNTTGAATTTTPTTTTTTTGTASADACNTCLGGATVPPAKYVACSANCTDQNCDDQCFNTACAGQETACDNKLNQCEAQCFGDDTGTGTDTGTNTGDDPCLSCLTPAASQYIQCSDQCQNQSCDDQCFEQACSGQENQCDSSLDSCSQQCGF